MIALLRNEWKAQQPFFWLSVFVGLLGLESLFDLDSMGGSVATTFNAWVRGGVDFMGHLQWFLIPFTLGLTLLPRERDEGTIEFLDALPCSRTQVFAAKLIMAILAIAPITIIGNGCHWVGHWANADSFDRSWHVPTMAKAMLLEWFTLVVSLCLGMGLSFFRRFAWLVLGLLFSIWMALNAAGLRGVERFHLLSTFDYRFRNFDLVVPWENLQALYSLAGVSLVVAYVWFLCDGDTFQRWGRAFREWRFRGCAIGFGMVGMGLVWIVIFITYSVQNGEELSEVAADQNAPEVREVVSDPRAVKREAGGYIFLYSGENEAIAEGLIALAPRVHDTVAGFFGREPVSGLVADLESTTRHNVAATANWKRVNLNLAYSKDPDELAAVLGHETTHVFIDLTGGDRIKDRFAATRWFHEGLASYVEYRFFRPPARIAEQHKIAAYASERQSVALEEIMNTGYWAARYDANLVYPLGHVFSEALVQVGGDEAPRKVVAALGNESRSSRLAAYDWWREACQEAGIDFSAVASAYYGLLKQYATIDYKAFVDSIPRLSARVKKTQATIILEPVIVGTLPPRSKLICQVRSQEDDSASEIQYLSLSPKGDFVIPRNKLTGRRFSYQMGLMMKETALPLFEPWREAQF